MPRPTCLVTVLSGLLVVTLASVPAATVADNLRGREPRSAARDVVDAVNAIVESDVPIPAAESTACSLQRLPGSRADLLALVPGRHRELIAECARGRTRLKRRIGDFDVLAMIEGRPANRVNAATARGFFAGRAVDVATGTGLSAGPYPIAFDWAIVLDPESETLFSFVLNCRD